VHNVSKLVTRAAITLGSPLSAAAPVIADGLVFVAEYADTFGQPGEIEAFPETCGAPQGLSCHPVWTAMVSYDDSAGLAVADGKVFVNTLLPSPELTSPTRSCGCSACTAAPAGTAPRSAHRGGRRSWAGRVSAPPPWPTAWCT
jgi:hypothetical protein